MIHQVKCLPSDSDLLSEGAHARLDSHEFPVVFAAGSLDALRGRVVALFCSQKCPGGLILKAYDLALALRRDGVTVISGFQSSMEKECLALLLRGNQPVVICPARSIEGMRFPGPWIRPLAEGRLLVISPFDSRARRATSPLVDARNRFAVALADEVLIIHAEPGGKVDQLARSVLSEGRPVLTLASEANGHLIRAGATTSVNWF
jgi:predicted Rossmann fold nucleotide-binding protein DprA/Smf involved in DNA uptake